MGSKMHCTCGDHLYGAFWTKSGHFGPSDDVFRGQKARCVTVWGLKTAWFAPKWPFWSPQGGPKGPKGGQWWLPCKYLKVGPFCGVWNQIWWRTRLLEGQKVSYRGQVDPPWPQLTSLRPPKNPHNCSPKGPYFRDRVPIGTFLTFWVPIGSLFIFQGPYFQCFG